MEQQTTKAYICQFPSCGFDDKCDTGNSYPCTAGLDKAKYVDEKRNPCQIYTSQLSKNKIFKLFTKIYSQRFYSKFCKRFPLASVIMSEYFQKSNFTDSFLCHPCLPHFQLLFSQASAVQLGKRDNVQTPDEQYKEKARKTDCVRWLMYFFTSHSGLSKQRNSM